MDVSIVITSYKNPQLLKVCLDSLKEYVSGITYELIVADSATEEATELMMREDYPDVCFFPNEKNVGFQALLKTGIQSAKAPYLLLLNGDIVVTQNAVQQLLTYIKGDSKIGIAAPKLLNFNGSLQYSCFRFYRPITIILRRTFLSKFNFAQRHLDWFLMKEFNHENEIDVDWVMGSALMVSKNAIEKVGFMDTRFFMYMEDVDWCRRFWEQGFKVMYYPKAQMLHYHGKGSDRGGVIRSLFNRLTWIHISSAIKYFMKYRGKKSPHISI